MHHASISQDEFEAIKKVLDPNTPEGLVNKVCLMSNYTSGAGEMRATGSSNPRHSPLKEANRLKYAALAFNEQKKIKMTHRRRIKKY